MTGHVLYE